MTACNPQSVSDDAHVDRMPSIAVYLSGQSFFLAAESLERSIESGSCLSVSTCRFTIFMPTRLS